MTKTESVETRHRTVLLNEAIEGLNLRPNSLVLDCTFGGGGHSLEICQRCPDVKIIALDQDQSVLVRGDKFQYCDISFFNENFRNLDKVLEKIGIAEVDGIIFDLGLSSDQLENSGPGFSCTRNEPLLMTMKENPLPEDITAKDVVNTWGEKSLADIIYGYGEEKQARPIAKAIVEFRKQQEIKTTFDLVAIIEKAIPARFRGGHAKGLPAFGGAKGDQGRASKIHYATKTFQAIRIAVNDELGALSEGLEKGFKFLKKEGRMSVISFHSLEDRIAKKFYKVKEQAGVARLINKKPITASKGEIRNNPRSRSAKLRILSRI